MEKRIAQLQDVTIALGSEVDPAQVAKIIIAAGVEAFGAQAGTVVLSAAEGVELEILSASWDVDEPTEVGEPTEVDEPTEIDPTEVGVRFPVSAQVPLGDAVRTEEQIWIETTDDCQIRYPHLVASQQAGGYVAVAALPLTVAGRVIGGFELTFDRSRTFSDTDRAYAMTLALLCAQALERTRLDNIERATKRGDTENALRERDEVLRMIAHDMKNKLAVIVLSAEVLEFRMAGIESPSAAALARSATLIHQTARRVARWADALVDVTRQASGESFHLNRKRTDLVALVGEIVNEQGSTLGKRRVQVTAVQPSIEGWWDQGRLARLLDNLLSNAIKYSPDGSAINIKLSIDEFERAIITVQDEGIGIPEDHLPFVFMPFRRARNVVNHTVGTGVGLASCRVIAEQHDGTISIESRENVGTTITVQLPLR